MNEMKSKRCMEKQIERKGFSKKEGRRKQVHEREVPRGSCWFSFIVHGGQG